MSKHYNSLSDHWQTMVIGPSDLDEWREFLLAWVVSLSGLLYGAVAALLLLGAWNVTQGAVEVAVLVLGSLVTSLLLQFAWTWSVKRRRIQRMSQVSFTLVTLAVSLILASGAGALAYWYLTRPDGSLGLMLTGLGGGLVVLVGLIWRDMRYW